MPLPFGLSRALLPSLPLPPAENGTSADPRVSIRTGVPVIAVVTSGRFGAQTARACATLRPAPGRFSPVAAAEVGTSVRVAEMTDELRIDVTNDDLFAARAAWRRAVAADAPRARIFMLLDDIAQLSSAQAQQVAEASRPTKPPRRPPAP